MESLPMYARVWPDWARLNVLVTRSSKLKARAEEAGATPMGLGESLGSGHQLPQFKSCLPHSLAVRPWTNSISTPLYRCVTNCPQGSD